MAVEFVNAEDFYARVVKTERPVLVSFRAKWCAQSLELGDLVEAFSSDSGTAWM